MALKARSAKAKGTRLEKLVADDLQALGLEAGKQPGSGIYEDYPSDNWAIIHGKRYIFECKARAEGHRTLDRWRGDADLLVIKRDRKEPMVYMAWSVFKEIVS